MFDIEIIEVKPHFPRKRRYAFCSWHRAEKTAVHTTINGQGRIARLFHPVASRRK